MPDIDKSLCSVGQLIKKWFRLLVGDKYYRIFDYTKQEISQVEMRGNAFHLIQHKTYTSLVTKDELTDLFRMTFQMRLLSTILDPRRSVVICLKKLQ